MLKRAMNDKRAGSQRVAEIGLMARRGLVGVAGAAVAAGLLTLTLAEMRTAAREPAVVSETGHALRHRPSTVELNEALGAFERFREQPDEARFSTARQRLAAAEPVR